MQLTVYSCPQAGLGAEELAQERNVFPDRSDRFELRGGRCTSKFPERACAEPSNTKPALLEG
jgi:hypothetical protein